MPMMKCPTCQGDVSTEADACPKCGHRFPRSVSSHSPIVIIGVIVLALLIVFFLKVF
jgi:predicted amidophosphoribosyltransferase